MNFLKLVKNSVSNIFFFLDLPSIASLCLANKRLYEIGCSDLLWKRKFVSQFQNLPQNQSKRFSRIRSFLFPFQFFDSFEK